MITNFFSPTLTGKKLHTLLPERIDHEKLGSKLSWKEFEEYAESIFESFDFQTKRNSRFRKPRAEIDLVASKSDLVFAVDCKHWNRTVGHASMLAIGERQLRRAGRLAGEQGARRVIPMIVTLHDEFLHILENGVPVVPIHKLSDFILNWEDARDEIMIVGSKTLQGKLT